MGVSLRPHARHRRAGLAPADSPLARERSRAAGLRHRIQARHQGARDPDPEEIRRNAQAAAVRRPQAAGDARLEAATRSPAVPDADLWSRAVACGGAGSMVVRNSRFNLRSRVVKSSQLGSARTSEAGAAEIHVIERTEKPKSV